MLHNSDLPQIRLHNSLHEVQEQKRLL